jgi:subtilisin family serine protease
MEGTSMATPIVTGIAALVLQQHPDMSINELDDVLIRSCAQLPGENQLRQGAGMIRIGEEIFDSPSPDIADAMLNHEVNLNPMNDNATSVDTSVNPMN